MIGETSVRTTRIRWLVLIILRLDYVQSSMNVLISKYQHYDMLQKIKTLQHLELICLTYFKNPCAIGTEVVLVLSTKAL